MVIPVFRGSKGEDPEVFFREYKQACIGTGLRTATEWLNFLLEFLEGTTSFWFERQKEKLKGSWVDITKVLMKEFSVKNFYQNLILELNQLKQGALELVREYKERTMTLQNKLQGCLRAQGDDGTNPIFTRINALVLEDFAIGLLSELRQQMRYEQAATFDEAVEVAEKKEVSMEEVPQPTVQSMVKIVQFSTEPELWKHPKVNSRMESAMEQMINQMNQLSLHLLQPRTSKSRNVKRDLSTIQCYKCQEMGHYSRECPNSPTLVIREYASSSTQRFSAEEKGKAQVHLIVPISEGRKKALMGLEQSLQIPKDAVDVMAQTKQSVEDITYPDVNVKRFKEMARAPKEKKKNWRRRFGFQDFPISRDSSFYLVVKDVGSQKADITIGQLVAMVPSARRELRKGLSTPKIPKVPTPLNAIIAERACDPIIDVQCNGSVLRGILVDGGAGINVMTIPAMKYLGLKIDKPALVTLKMTNKRVIRPKRVISNVVITVMRVSTIVDFHVVLEEDGAYPMILSKPWLTKSHARNYWAKDT